MTIAIQEGRPQDEQIVGARPGTAAIGELEQAPLGIPRSIWQVRIEELFSVAVRIGHLVVQMLVVVALHELHTLILNPQVVAVRRKGSP